MYISDIIIALKNFIGGYRMSMRKPLIIEFTGPPNSGKTTLIKFLRDLLESMEYRVEVKQEDAELVPSCIPKKTWARNVWITYGQLQSLIETKFSEADIILLDRGFCDSMFWANFLQVQHICTSEESSRLLKILDEMDKEFHLKPDYLFVIDVSTEVSLKRRYAASSEPVVLSTNEFIDLYKDELEKFYKKVELPMFRLNTSLLTLIEMQEIVLNEILQILKKD